METKIETVGIRAFSRAVSSYVRKAALGVRVYVSDRGRVVAELTKPGEGGRPQVDPRIESYLASNAIHPGCEASTKLKLPRGEPLVKTKVKDLIDAIRGY